MEHSPLEELKEITSLLRLHLIQKQESSKHLLIQEPTWFSFKSQEQKTQQTPIVEKKPLLQPVKKTVEPPQKPVIKKEPTPQKHEVFEVKQEPEKPMTISFRYPLPQLFQVNAFQDTFQDIAKKIQGQHFEALHTPISDQDAIAKDNAWKSSKLYPKTIICSFFQKNSSEHAFLLTVTDAIDKKLTSAMTILSPELLDAQNIVLQSIYKTLKVVLLVYSIESEHLMRQFVDQFGLTKKDSAKDMPPLSFCGTMQGTNFYLLKLLPKAQIDQSFKGALWNTLKLLCQP